jgi:iron complex transport system ATP-binding protein
MSAENNSSIDKKPAVDIADLSVEIARTPILHACTLQAQQGTLTAICGPNGCGKSTLLRALCGLQAASHGQIAIGGHAIHELTASERARRIAWVPQHSEIAGGTEVQAVVRLGRFAHHAGAFRLSADDQAIVASAMAHCDVAHLATRLIGTLSGGERARVLLARALATEAPLICLDEPTASLDLAHAYECLELCRDIATKGQTVVMVLHRLDEVERWADHVVVLHQGAVVTSGAPKDTLSDAVLHRVWGVERRVGQADAFTLLAHRKLS